MVLTMDRYERGLHIGPAGWTESYLLRNLPNCNAGGNPGALTPGALYVFAPDNAVPVHCSDGAVRFVLRP